MKVLIFLALLSLCLAGIPRAEEKDAPEPQEDYEDWDDNDPDNSLGEDEFETEFGVDKITDPEEKAKRKKALKDSEAEVKKENKKYLNGKADWFEHINEFSNLPEDEFLKEKTGFNQVEEYARGFIMPEVKPVDEESERYFESLLLDKASIPASYNAVTAGLVSSVKNQQQCGSCAAFASMAAIETCMKKASGGKLADFSEQQILDCGYGKNGARGCNGAGTQSYIKYVADNSASWKFTHESTYPYKNKNPSLTCPSSSVAKPYNTGAKVTKAWYTYSGSEAKLKALVAKHGAVVTAINAGSPLDKYSGGVFSGCTSSQQNHAVTVVGYGTSNNVDYWLIKNSWGASWGEKGYIRLKRGVGMCGIGTALAVPSCVKVAGATSAPLTTKKPCVDKYTNCPTLAKTYCSQLGMKCAKSCGKCAGMTPVASNSCADQFGNCKQLAKTMCYNSRVKKACCISCGLGKGMTPAKSNTCWDRYSNCSQLCSTSIAATLCKKSCSSKCK